MAQTRRQFIGNLLKGAGAAAVATSSTGLLLPEEPEVQRYWQVGSDLRPGAALQQPFIKYTEGANYKGGITYDPGKPFDIGGGLVPIQGQPGMFRDMGTGKVVFFGSFKETSKYNSIATPDERLLKENPGEEYTRDFRDSDKVGEPLVIRPGPGAEIEVENVSVYFQDVVKHSG